MKKESFDIEVNSEIGKLEHVIIHSPGPEVENVTPFDVERALYSDILNLSVASREYKQLKNVLSTFSKTYEISDLLLDVMKEEKARSSLIENIARNMKDREMANDLFNLDPKILSKYLIEGLPLKKNNLTRYLSKEEYALQPLHNFFFTRDVSFTLSNQIYISKMANNVRTREAMIMEAILKFHPMFTANIVTPLDKPSSLPEFSFEGGDIIIAREDILIIGIGSRTNSHGIDYIIENLKINKKEYHLIVQELPHTPESFIHLDMTFTLLDDSTCMVYEPLIIRPNKYQTVYINVNHGKVKNIKNVKSIPDILATLDMKLKPVMCGGDKDPIVQEREQWHSGCNFFALAPGVVIGYDRNVNTLEALNKNGFEIIKSKELSDKHLDEHKKYVITIPGSELSRGGGGARCMTMPLKRLPL